MPKKASDQYSKKEAQERFEAALRGARTAATQSTKTKPTKKTKKTISGSKK
jgi:hypothetical protein